MKAGGERKRKIFIWLGAIITLIACIVVLCAVYLGDYYRADNSAIEAYNPYDAPEAEVLSDGTLVYNPGSATVGFIFYPGGKVEHTAYVPLMQQLYASGVLCILAKMPFNLAIFGINAADGFIEAYPEVESWYIGGHSLGGSMAASYAEGNSEKIDGLILLAAYSTADISETDLRVLSVYGSADGVLNTEKYEKSKKNLPKDYVETVIEGGSHAYFGMYGEQDGDGQASISNERQIELTKTEILKFINSR